MKKRFIPSKVSSIVEKDLPTIREVLQLDGLPLLFDSLKLSPAPDASPPGPRCDFMSPSRLGKFGLMSSGEVGRRHWSFYILNDLGDVYPSGLKLALRYHLRTLCETPRCADSLVIYLNSPTRPDGASLLWDKDDNGEVCVLDCKPLTSIS
ncbi:unnamed protein product [Nesidiocoris tenuis]|uniref:Uncharacterized protein n=1 Tax=Nesidiocoris tenuis TaxID=355587 RepID=A0A6H5G0Z8_9HEMI|nr:unnamed protein product [Nesidiocoris tenuis]